MNSKYLFIGLTIITILAFAGIGIYMYSNNDSPATLGAQAMTNHISPSDFKTAIDSGEYTLLDIRTAQEFSTGHIAGASQSDFYQSSAFSTYLDSLNKNKKYLIYCRSGNRSGQALSIMKEKGFTNVSDLSGGITAWYSAGLPIEK
jgi:rhodanese-related sulfurtransferase